MTVFKHLTSSSLAGLSLVFLVNPSTLAVTLGTSNVTVSPSAITIPALGTSFSDRQFNVSMNVENNQTQPVKLNFLTFEILEDDKLTSTNNDFIISFSSGTGFSGAGVELASGGNTTVSKILTVSGSTLETNRNLNEIGDRDAGDSLEFLVRNESVTGTIVPEPLTILGSGLALGFGAYFKKEYSRKQKKTKAKA